MPGPTSSACGSRRTERRGRGSAGPTSAWTRSKRLAARAGLAVDGIGVTTAGGSRGSRSRGTPTSPQRRPFRAGTFTSRLHDERVAAILGIALGVSFSICFLDRALLAPRPASAELVRAPRPAGRALPPHAGAPRGDRHRVDPAAAGQALGGLPEALPLAAVRPLSRASSSGSRCSRSSPAVSSCSASGLANINLWYPWQFSFPVTHYWVAWITIGALVVHVGAKRATTLRALRRREQPVGDVATKMREDTLDDRPGAAVADRRGFLAGVFATSGLLTAVHGRPDVPTAVAARAPVAPAVRRRAAGLPGEPHRPHRRGAGVRAVTGLPARRRRQGRRDG